MIEEQEFAQPLRNVVQLENDTGFHRDEFPGVMEDRVGCI